MKNRFNEILESKESQFTNLFDISLESLMYDMMKGSIQSLNNYKRMLREQFYNISYLAGNFTTTFSEDGIYIFLDDNDKHEDEKNKKLFLIS